MGGMGHSDDSWYERERARHKQQLADALNRERKEKQERQIDAWRWGMVLTTVGWAVFIVFMTYSTFWR